MKMKRFNHSSCTLGDTIYVFGGNNGSSLLDTIETYSPKYNIWTFVPNLRLPTFMESPALLIKGYSQILIIGGRTNEKSLATILEFNPLAKVMNTVGTMQCQRNNPKVGNEWNELFIFGGTGLMTSEYCSLKKEMTFSLMSSYDHIIQSDLASCSSAISQINVEYFTKELQTYSPEQMKHLYIFGTDAWKKILRLNLEKVSWDSIPVPTSLNLWGYSIAYTLPNGKIMLTGGINSALNDIKSTAYLLTIVPNSTEITVEAIPNLLQRRYTHTCCYLNKYLYVLGGREFGAGINGVIKHCERYNLDKKKWELISPLNERKCTAVAYPFMNKVHIFGGYRGDGRNRGVERYNEFSNRWDYLPLLLKYPIEAEGLVPLSTNEFILLGGKDDFQEQSFSTIYNLERKTFDEVAPMKSSRILLKCGVYNNEIFVVGGNENTTCERASIGIWDWNNFTSYDFLLDGCPNKSLTKAASAQSI